MIASVPHLDAVRAWELRRLFLSKCVRHTRYFWQINFVKSSSAIVLFCRDTDHQLSH